MADDDQAQQQGDGSYYNDGNLSVVCPGWAPALGFTGIAAAVVFASTLPISPHAHTHIVRMDGST